MKIESYYSANDSYNVIKAGEDLYLPLLLESADKDNKSIYGTLYLSTSEELEFYGSKYVIIQFNEIKKGRNTKKVFIVRTASGNEFEFNPVSFDKLKERYRRK